MHTLETKMKSGFTLIELMVTIAIIGILAGVILVSLSSFGAKGRLSATQQALHSVMPAVLDCGLRGQTLTTPQNDVEICSGSGIKWPPLNTSSTHNCTWETAKFFGDSAASWYSAICSDANARVVCMGTADQPDWGADYRSGACVVESPPK